MGTHDTYVGEQVHELMWRQKVQQRQVYEAIGLSRSSLAKKMRGQIGWSLDELMIVARLLGVTPNDLLLPAAEGE